jgi:cytosine/adenosine deaminase-related metal-dependent hydrolase
VKIRRAHGFVLGLSVLAFAFVACGGDDGGGGGGSGTGGSGALGGLGGNDSGLGGTAGGGTGGVAGGGTGGIAGAGGSTGGSGGVGPGTDLVVTECGKTLTPPAQGTCEVTTTGTKGVRLVGNVLGPQEVFHGGEVLIDDTGVIRCVGCDCSSAAGASDASTVTCANGVISPGLINSHDHITYANNKPAPTAVRYDHRHEWRVGANGKPEIPYASGASTNVVLAAELRFVMSGTTSAVSAGGTNHLLRNLDTGNKEGLPSQTVDSDTFPLGDASGVMITSGCNYPSGAKESSEIANLNAYQPHISEGVNQAARNEMTCTTAGSHDVVEPQTTIVHAIAVTPTEAAAIQAEHAWVVWSPRSNISLYGNTAPITLLDNMGVGIMLGTDWLLSGSMNLSRELKCADDLNKALYGNHFSDFDLWRMVTTNAAFGAGVEKGLGLLKPGYTADIAIFDGSVNADHRAVIASEPKDVVLVLRGGEPLYGDDALVASPAIGGAACETIDVCTVSKRACVAKDTGGPTLAQVVAAGNPFAEAFSCGAPVIEPTCVPSRPNQYDGVPTATDNDGDGVPNATDVCPDVFDPARPLDQGQQGNADGDAKGDACDPCPSDPSDACAALDADDFDSDGWANAVDNCAEVANGDQTDTDGDGNGDACDPCPSTPNPLFQSCPLVPTSIKAVRDPSDPNHPQTGATVLLNGLYVTALRPNTGTTRGFYIQDTSLTPFTGIFVFTASTAPTVQVGNKVDISGVYDEFFDLSEITNPVVTITDAGTTLPFAPIAIANPSTIATGGAQAEGYESMLVSITNVTVTVMNPDAPQDFDEFAVTGNLRIDDLLHTALDNTYAVGTPFAKIVGVHGFAFANYKLSPRNAADITP